MFNMIWNALAVVGGLIVGWFLFILVMGLLAVAGTMLFILPFALLFAK